MITSSLLAYYKLDNNTNDSYHSYHLSSSSTGSITYTRSIIDNGAVLSDKYLYTNDIDLYPSGSQGSASAYTYSGWVKLPSLENCSLLSYGPGGGTTIRIEDSKITMWQSPDAVNWVGPVQGPTATTGSWYFVAGRWSPNTPIVLTVNSSHYSSSVNVSSMESTKQFHISSEGWGYQSPGTFDEVGVWNRKLTDNEISILYNQGHGTSY